METTMNAWLALIPEFLRSPETLWEEIRRGKHTATTVFRLGLLTAGCLAVYGFALGLSHSWPQAVSSAVKMPLLVLATILFCLPALHFFLLAVLRTPLRMVSTVAVVLAGIGVTAFLLLGLSPVTLFFVLTSENYPFFQLLAVVFVSVSGCIGLSFIWRGMEAVHSEAKEEYRRAGRGILAVWMGLYGFVATQMAWRLSPLVGDPEIPFVVLRPSRDNFYVDVLNALQKAFGGPLNSADGGLLAFSLMCAFYVLLLAFIVWLLRKVFADRSKQDRGRQPSIGERNAAQPGE
jgi:succinate dehydrogenase hydrophobic anchor subunit